MRNAQYYHYALDLPEIAEVWRRGSVIGSWLLDLTATALLDDPELKRGPLVGFRRRAVDARGCHRRGRAGARRSSGASRLGATPNYADRLLSAMRKQFGGHGEKTRGGS